MSFRADKDVKVTITENLELMVVSAELILIDLNSVALEGAEEFAV